VILVTGATGFIGAEILRRASGRGWRVRGLARHPERAEALGRLPHVELFRGDLTDPGSLTGAFEDVDAVVHLVGIIVETGDQTFESVHVGGTRAALEEARRAGVGRFVHMSALGVESGRKETAYLATKARAEELVRESGLSATVFRPSIVIGRDSAIVSRLRTALRWSPVVPLPGGGRQRLQPVWVGDVAECFLQAARAPRSPRAVYEVAGPEVLTLREMVQTLAGAMGKRRAILSVPSSLARAGAAIAGRLPGALVTSDQLTMLEMDNVADPAAVAALRADFEIEHPSLAQKAPELV